jgi:hypothetical protein
MEVRRDAAVLRTALSVTAAAVAAACGLAACGSVQLGAAAIVGNQRISTATLTAQVSSLESVLQTNKAKIQLQFPRSQSASRWPTGTTSS